MRFASLGEVDIKIIPTIRKIIDKGKNTSSANKIIKTEIKAKIIPTANKML
ncbi:MAG: hypothetical protein ACW98X_19345 [Promethearchaeota archaeon]|jgi:hypothetical protein